jgi:hypothetical protein
MQSYRLHPEEVDALVAITLDGARDLFAGETDSVTASECPRDSEPFDTILTRDDFAIRDQDYVMAILSALGGILKGETPETFDLRTTIAPAAEC